MSATPMAYIFILILAVPAFSQPFRWGADLSFVPKLEHHGAVYSRSGYEQNVLEMFRAAGIDVVRIRLWHSPEEPWYGIDSVLALAERADALGFEILIDIHYSDTWADPEHQTMPAAWQGLSYSQLLDSVYRYTNEVMIRFRDRGVFPESIQIGNEVGGGFLWEAGRVDGSPQQWTQFVALLDTAIAGAKDSLPQPQWPKIIIHHQEGADSAACRWFFDNLTSRNVPFDIIGLSYYPWWHGSLEDLSANLNDLSTRYNKEVSVVETAYPWMTGWCDTTGNIVGDHTPLLPLFPATPTGQAFFLLEIQERMLNAPNVGIPLLCAWEPAWIPADAFGSPWENLAFFDCEGNAVVTMNIFSGLAPTNLSITRIGNDIELRWNEDASLFYKIYASDASGGPYNQLVGSTPDRSYLLPNEFGARQARFFVVKGSPTP